MNRTICDNENFRASFLARVGLPKITGDADGPKLPNGCGRAWPPSSKLQFNDDAVKRESTQHAAKSVAKRFVTKNEKDKEILTHRRHRVHSVIEQPTDITVLLPEERSMVRLTLSSNLAPHGIVA